MIQTSHDRSVGTQATIDRPEPLDHARTPYESSLAVWETDGGQVLAPRADAGASRHAADG